MLLTAENLVPLLLAVVVAVILGFAPAIYLYRRIEDEEKDWRVLWLSISIILFVVLTVLLSTKFIRALFGDL